MKRLICFLIAAVISLTLVGCGADDNSKSLNSGSKTVDDVLEQQTATETKAPVESNTQTVKTDEASDVDVDLTTLSSTMVYSEVYNMLTSPNDYVGKTVKMNGKFAMYHDDATGANYFACIIADATACCSQGIEFILAGDYKYPDDYPKLDSEITVTGTFSTYMEGENMYCTLKDAAFVG